MLHRAFAVVFLLAALSTESLATKNSSGKSATASTDVLAASLAASCAAPSKTVTVTVAASAAATNAAGSSSSSSSGSTGSSSASSGKGSNNASSSGSSSSSSDKGSSSSGKGSTTTAQGSSSTSSAVQSSTSTAAASSGKGGNNAGSGSAAGNNNASGAQSSLTLLNSVIATGFESDGQDPPTPGQIASLTSSNNFINFCATTNLPITNGQQVKTGSCNPAPMGMLPSVDKMVSSKFTNPKNLDTITANQSFTITMAIQNINSGNFVNAQKSYYAAPQFLDSTGQITGHSHFMIQEIDSLTSTQILDPQVFTFFQGVNTAAVNGVLSVNVSLGVPPGVYRMCSINAAANHQPVLMPVAQHGSVDDCVYFTAKAAAGASNAQGQSNATGSSSAAAAATSKVSTKSQSSGKTKNSRSRRRFTVARH